MASDLCGRVTVENVPECPIRAPFSSSKCPCKSLLKDDSPSPRLDVPGGPGIAMPRSKLPELDEKWLPVILTLSKHSVGPPGGSYVDSGPWRAALLLVTPTSFMQRVSFASVEHAARSATIKAVRAGQKSQNTVRGMFSPYKS